MTAAFFLTSLLIVMAPGSGVVYTLTISLSQGLRAGVLAVCGCTLGAVPHLVAAVSGVALFIHGHPQALQLMKYAGGAWLLYLAWQLWRANGAMLVPDAQPASGGVRIMLSGVLINLLNPKLTLFFFAFLPQFVTDGAHAVDQMALLGLIFIVMTFVVFLLYGLFAAALRDRVITRPGFMLWFYRCAAGAFFLLSMRLIVF